MTNEITALAEAVGVLVDERKQRRETIREALGAAALFMCFTGLMILTPFLGVWG